MDAHLERHPPQPTAIRRIACAVDFGPNDHNTLEAAEDVAGKLDARLTLVHVTPSVEMYGPGGTRTNPDWQRLIVGSAKTRIDELRRELRTNADTQIASGDVPRALSAVATELNADLVVIGSRHSAGAWRSTGYGIICASRVPVLSV